MRLTRSLSLLLLLIYNATGILLAQERWRTYLSYGATVEVAETASHLFALSEEGTLLSIQKNDHTNQRIYGREDGLSEAQPAHIAYAPSAQTLLLPVGDDRPHARDRYPSRGRPQALLRDPRLPAQGNLD